MSLQYNVKEKADLIWAIADKLTGVYKPHEYGEVILPLTVIRRFDCALADTKDKVLKKNETLGNLPMKHAFLCKESGFSFYNTSKYNFEKLLDDPDNIEENFRAYINGFSENVRNIIEKFKFDAQIATLAQKNLLYIVIQEFTSEKANLHPNKISNLEMGYVFEEIIRRFSEAHNEDAGQHYTPREVIELMVNILFNEDSSLLTENIAKTIYDPACGTGGMLSVAQEHLKELNKDAELISFGQEINDQTFAICQADMLIKGEVADNIKNGNTLSDDQFKDEHFDYILSNPPFGREWKNDKKVVEAEHKLGFAGRFGAGLPAVGDGQMLFLQTAIAKMKPQGARVAIIHNGSPLFTGDAGSGPSNIRKYILENDLLEAIIALPNDIFYNTGIATYIWILSNKKPAYRKGKVQLINANGLYEKRRKSLGNKRNDIPPKYIEEITKTYAEFKETEISKIFDNEDFGYYKIVVDRPKRYNFSTAEDRLKNLEIPDMLDDLKDGTNPLYPHIQSALRQIDQSKVFKSEEEFSKLVVKTMNEAGLDTPKFLVDCVLSCLEEYDETAEPIKNKNGKLVPETSLRDTENVPLKEDIDEYFQREVLPFAPDAWIDQSKTKVGYEIPFTRYFYKYEAPRPSEEIMAEIMEIEKELDGVLEAIFRG